MKSVACCSMLMAAGLWASACVQEGNSARTTEKALVAVKALVAEKPFVTGGKIDMQLDGGGYEIRPAADDRIRFTSNGNTGDAKVELTANGTHADVRVKDTPHNFRATIEVPKAADLVIRLSGGDLVMAAITGNKDVESYGGDIKIVVGDPSDYSSVDASVKAGDIEAGVFGGSKSGLLQHFTWSGQGKYTLRAQLGAGSLVLRTTP
jgi:hypothetical protein